MSAPKKKAKKRWLFAKLDNNKFAQMGFSPWGVGVVHVLAGMVAVLIGAWTLAWKGFLLLMYSSPLWLMYIVPKSVTFYWVHYVQHEFVSGDRTRGVLLEIRIPKDVPHSPKAMELVFDALHFRLQMATKFLTKWRGHTNPWYSFEIASFYGELKMYVWCWKRLQSQVEAAMYAQYPTIQLVEVPDYAQPYIDSRGGVDKLNTWGNAMMLEKPDVYPIKTYYDFQLDQDPKAEHKHDPFVSVLEQMASTAKDEILWLQILIQPEWDSKKWKEAAMLEIKNLYDKTRKPFKNAQGVDQPGYAQLKPMQYEVVRAIERSTTKHAFRTMIRGIVIFEGKYNNIMTQTLNRMWVPVGAGGTEFFNYIKLDPVKYTSGFDYPWELRSVRRPARVRDMLDAYVTRNAFLPPHIEDFFLLTSEELATIYHIPGADSQVPGLKKIDSLQKGAPPNLPV